MYSKNPVKSDQDAKKSLLVNECLIKKQITIFVPWFLKSFKNVDHLFLFMAIK